MNRKRVITISIVCFFMAALLSVVGFFIYQKYFKINVNQQQYVQDTIEPEKDYLEINDESAGISFKIPKNFKRIPGDDLRLKNPNFMYGFSIDEKESLNCFVSQTEREKPGEVKISYLRDGILEQMRKAFPDAEFDSAEMVALGDNNVGVKFFFVYTDNGIPMLQVEVVGITDKAATFAFCTVAANEKDLYWDDINMLLNSLKIR